MMQDVTFDDIIDEIVTDFRIPLPRKMIRTIIKTSLTRLFNILERGDTSVKLNRGIGKFYNNIDFEKLTLEFMDLDETKPPKPLISKKLLNIFRAKRSPYTKFRGSSDVTYIYHKRISGYPIRS